MRLKPLKSLSLSALIILQNGKYFRTAIMRATDIILKKKNGMELSEDELRFMIEGFTSGDVPDYQMSAFTMTVCFQGMSGAETKILTECMMNSGETADLSAFGDITVDKHSTGGVGDKTSLIVGPIAASLGCSVAKMSGRGLGHTGGTVDKLESIEGFKTELSVNDFFEQVKNTGIAVIGQSGDFAPADKKLYALRDVTATVDSIPLIASSIMSKKLAAGAKSIVLDVKCGSGAFMKDEESASALAEVMVDIGKALGRNVCAVITDMDTPLGRTVGNSLEVKEAISALKGNGDEDLKTVCIELASNMVSMAKKLPYDEAKEQVLFSLESGMAFEKFKEWIKAQGGSTEWLDNTELFPEAPVKKDVLSVESGYVTRMDAEAIGNCACILGAGRTKKDSPIDYSAGITINAKTGDYVKKGDVLATLHTSDKDTLCSAERLYREAVTVSKDKPKDRKLIIGVVK